MPKGQRINEHTKEKAVTLLAIDDNQERAAKALGLSQPSLSRIAKERQKDIKQLTLEIIAESIPHIKAIHINTLSLADRILASVDGDEYPYFLDRLELMGLGPKDILTLSDKKEQRALQIMCISPTHTESKVFNFYQDNRIQMLSTEVLAPVHERVAANIGAVDAQCSLIVEGEGDKGGDNEG